MQYKTVETVPSEISAWLQEPSSDCRASLTLLFPGDDQGRDGEPEERKDQVKICEKICSWQKELLSLFYEYFNG